MDKIWQELPEDLSDRVCNMLIKIRRIPTELKNQILDHARFREFCELVGDIEMATRIIIFVLIQENHLYHFYYIEEPINKFALAIWNRLYDEGKERCFEIFDENNPLMYINIEILIDEHS
jgi:hypothetical protein